MVDAVSFQTRARTIDHLGREQIADCPTAISELWKNAYDAYAHKVELHIFDGAVPVCGLVDDGHGMDKAEFETKWLTVGTESKATGSEVPLDDRNGLAIRPKQGQKGIGRLSSAALGKLLLLVSKRKNAPFVAALLDWRLFENPFLMLQDIYIPIVDFNDKEELLELMPELFDKLLGNIWGDQSKGADEKRNVRIDTAWQLFDEQEASEDKRSTKTRIEETVIGDAFDSRHLSAWPVWSGDSSHGTAMFMVDLHDDMLAQLSKTRIDDAEATEKRARKSFVETLSNFTDPFARDDEAHAENFSNVVIAWHGDLQQPIIAEDREFGLSDIDDLEHLIDGNIDSDGFFKGRVKAFGVWHENVVIKPSVKYKTRKDTYFGSFSLRFGAYEALPKNTTLPDGLHAHFIAQSERYSGVMIYRDGLRVMPYGREDNDYFEIEKRRTFNAGRYFWSNRRTFGRISISRENNPNLKDKAGREGLLDNRASKLFRDIVEKILVDVADRYMGRNSPDRKQITADIKATKLAEKAEIDKKKLLIREQRRVKTAIKKQRPHLEQFVAALSEMAEEFAEGLHLDDEDAAATTKQRITQYTGELSEFSLSPLPSSLGSAKTPYKEYRQFELRAKELLKALDCSVNAALSKFVNVSDYELALKTFNSKASQLQAAIRKLSKDGKQILSEAAQDFGAIVDARNKAYHQIMSDDLEDLKLGKTTLSIVLDTLDDEFYKQDFENIQQLKPYVTALNNIKEKIDLEGLAIHSINEMEKWKAEAGRIHQLAQLGITVEIIGHEIEGLDMTITRNLKALKNAGLNPQQNIAYDSIMHAQQSLSDKWRFLSPLKLSGDKTRIEISGKRIFDYIQDYFGELLERSNIELTATPVFLNLAINEQPARLFPVFINLVNNAQYWVRNGEEEPHKIILDFQGDEIVVADNGPGVEREDYDQLFTLFFTRKQRGGRGVGLYLCKQNLQAGGHKIRYETNGEGKILSGANFMLTLKGVINGKSSC